MGTLSFCRGLELELIMTAAPKKSSPGDCVGGHVLVQGTIQIFLFL